MVDPHRQMCKRQHRVMGNYLATQAWLSRLDCIVLDRSDLERFLNLKRFKNTRIKWLRSDLKPWFQYQKAYYKTNAESSISSLFLSREPISKHLLPGSMTTQERIDGMGSDAPPTKLLSKTTKHPLYREVDIIADLTLAASGLLSPLCWKEDPITGGIA